MAKYVAHLRTLILVGSCFRTWAVPAFDGLQASLEAAADLCQADVQNSRESNLTLRLQALVHGRVLSCPTSEGAFVDATAALWVSGYASDADVKPALVLQPADTADVSAAVLFAQSENITLAVKGGGLSVRSLWLAPEGLTIDLSSLDTVEVDLATNRVTAGGGAVYTDIIAATQPYNLAVPWGDADVTGMGLALGGGIGYLLRSHGLTTDNIVAATLVIANGTVVSVNSTQHPDVLAALHGGGSALGAVTSLTLQAYDISSYTGGVLTLADDDNCTNTRAAHQWAVGALEQVPQLGMEILRASSPAGDTVTVTVGIPGGMAEAARQQLLEPLRMLDGIVQDELDQLDYYAHQQVLTNASSAMEFGYSYVLGAAFTFQQAEDAILDMLPALLVDLPEGMTNTLIADYLGNSVADNAVRNTTSFTPFAGDVDVHYAISYFWLPGDNDTSNAAFAQNQINMLKPYVISTQPYINLATVVNNQSLEAQVGGPSNLARFRSMKQQLDPNNVFSRHSFVGL